MRLTPDQARARAEALCARSEHCAADIRAKARTWGLTADETDALIDHLTAEAYVDEARYAHAVVHDKLLYDRWGRLKILHALRAKGIDPGLARRALDEAIDPEAYAAGLADLLRARMKGMARPLSPADRARLCRFAAQRGYEGPAIGDALADLGAEPDD